MIEIPPGVVYLAHNAPSVVTPIAGVYLLNLTASKWLGIILLPSWLVMIAYVLALPFALFLVVQYQNFIDWRTARNLGAELPPKVGDRTPGSLAVLARGVRNMKHGYIADDMEPLINEHGRTFVIRLLFANRVFTCEPAYLKAILATQFEDFDKGLEVRNLFQPLLGTGVFAADGDMWRFHRSIARPFFTKDRIQHFDIFDRHADDALNQMRARLREGYPVDFQDLVARFTLDSATEFLFGQDTGSLSAGLEYPHYSSLHEEQKKRASTHPSTRFVTAFAEAQLKTAARTQFSRHWPLAEFWEDKMKASMKIVHEFIEPILREAVRNKKEMEEKGIGENKEPDTLLEHLVNTTNDHTILRDQIMSLLVAGRDTTASTLTFTVYMLAEHPKVLRKLRDEIMTKVGSVRRPTFDDFREMKYLRAVINETLRLYPPVPFNIRTSTKATTLDPQTPNGKRWYIPPETRTIYSVWVMHRRKEFWGPDALKFDPERFIDHRLQKYLIPNPFIFLPFNAGPRICLGQAFAYNEVSFFLVRLLQAFEKIEIDVNALPEEFRVPKGWSEGVAEAGNAEGKGEDETKERTKAVEKVWVKSHLTLHAAGGVWMKMEEASGGDIDT